MVHPILPSGLCILAGRPKSGKSILVLNLAVAVAHGSNIYIDRGISGGNIDRPNFQRMLENIKQGNFPHYLYIKGDKRLFRDELEAGDKVEWILSQLEDKSNTDSPNLLTVSCRTLAV